MRKYKIGVSTTLVIYSQSHLVAMDRRKQIARQLRIGVGIFLAALMLAWATYACSLIATRTEGQVAELSMVR